MKKHIQSYSQGLNQDVSTNKYPQNNFYWAQNFRLVSKDGLATGALTNVDGTSSKLDLGIGHNVLSVCTIRDTLIMFVESGEGGKIFMWEHSTSDFEESPTLIYTDPDLDFSSDHPVRAVGRYETENIQKIYFTDGYSFFKHLNIIPQDGEAYPLNLYRDVDSLDLVTDIDFSSIDLNIIPGGNLKAGKIQYAYQLYSKRGSESTFSPASQLISLTSSDSTQSSYHHHGSEIGEDVNKSVVVTIDDLDPDDREIYTRLRLVALEYTVYDQIPSVRIVGEYNIEDLESLSVTDSGYSIGEMTLEEFRFIQNTFYPKSLDIKDDRLFAANIKNVYFEITDAEFDARAFRFNSSQEARVYNGNNEVVVDSTWASLPDFDQELYNRFNDWTNDYNEDLANVTTYHYKYQSDGTTLGGEGPNISYKFITDRVLLDDSAKQELGWQGIHPKQTLDCTDASNYVDPFLRAGYKRDEVYRFGIIFFDGKGRQSFVKWIGDIRFPSNEELPFIYYDSSTDQNKTYADILGIEFTVTIPSEIEDDIAGYQIVRAERKTSDKTILTQSVMGYMKDGSKPSSDNDILAEAMYSNATMTYTGECIAGQTLIEQTTSSVTNSQDKDYRRSGKTLRGDYVELTSPEIAFNKPSYSTSDAYIEVEGYLTDVFNTGICGPSYSDDQSIVISDKYRSYGFPSGQYKYRKGVDTYKTYRPEFKNSPMKGTDHWSNDASIHVLDSETTFNNQCSTGDVSGQNTYGWFGQRGTFGLVKLDEEFGFNAPWGGSSDKRIFVANYRIDRGKSLYGGSSYESRLNTTYYPVGAYIDKDTTTVEVYDGDTFINYMWYFRSMWDDSYTTTSVRVSDNIIEVVMMLPFESSINVDLRLDQPQKYMAWAYPRGGETPNYKLMELAKDGVSIFSKDYPEEVGNLYRYNSVYSCMDKSKEFFPKPFDFEQTLINDTRIQVSEKKINGEYIDSWTKFKFNNYIDVDSKHHEITKILTFKNNLFYFQPTAVGIVSVNPRSLIQDNNTSQLVLGTGGILDRYDYITDKSGSEFYDAILGSDDFMFYADGRRKRINKIVPGKEVAISVVKGIDSTLDKLSWETAVAGFDRGYNEVVFAIDDTTVAFSEMADAFVSSYTFNPSLMFSIGGDFYSVGTPGDEDDSPWLYSDLQTDKVGYSGSSDSDPDWDYVLIGPGSGSAGSVVYKHNVGDPGEFYGATGGADDSYLTLIINPEGNNVCFFDNLDIRTESTLNGVDDPDDVFYRMEAENNYQDMSRELSFTMDNTDATKGYTYNAGTIKRIGRIWRTPIIPVAASGVSYSRMLDTYLKVTLRYSNTGRTFRVHDIILYYRTAKN